MTLSNIIGTRGLGTLLLAFVLETVWAAVAAWGFAQWSPATEA